ncbi:hypothetical protein LZA78_00255 [Sinirhodobacter sp. WL0062]|uniref:Uncharacterized protein n=1 Tax=Rhodobacter flavimaris TaxID=2907145 RepID=A0ABS8YU00_9RHOB|nr:hypothetical protein [Sinirhodobacter sp. WL0062]MCE5971921.1 hypothetical protein [Sinirhodobacter sp. WL0062]
MKAIVCWRDPRHGSAVIYSVRDGALVLLRGARPADCFPPVDRLLTAELLLQRLIYLPQETCEKGRAAQRSTAPEPCETGS